METIKTIEEIKNVKVEGEYSAFDGYRIETSDQVIDLLIDNEQSCCEDWGYFISEDDTAAFLGANLLNVTLTDTALKTKDLPEYGVDAGDTMFVNLETDRGVLQFVAYNAHNGYYGHSAIVRSKQLQHSTTL